MFSIVQSVLCEVFSVKADKISMETSINNLKEWDSMNQLRLVMELEKKLQIRFSPSEMAKLDSVKNILEQLQKKKAA
jgi:acyl carrier protein